jgi:hypothetical protein
MDVWWIVLVGVLRSVRARSGDAGPTQAADQDFVEERESSRLGAMSEEDRAWQAASLEKNRANRDESPPVA